MAGADFQNMSPEEIQDYQKKNCIFCKIINKEIPSTEIFSDDKVMIILDINPANEGHCLILPKQHYQILPQIPEDLMGYLFVISKRTSKALLQSLGAKGTSIFVANGAVAGQKSPHFMIHVVPRKEGDMLFGIPKNAADEKKLEGMRNNLSARISALTGKKMPPAELTYAEPKPGSNESKEENPVTKDVDLDDIAKLFGK